MTIPTRPKWFIVRALVPVVSVITQVMDFYVQHALILGPFYDTVVRSSFYNLREDSDYINTHRTKEKSKV